MLRGLKAVVAQGLASSLNASVLDFYRFKIAKIEIHVYKNIGSEAAVITQEIVLYDRNYSGLFCHPNCIKDAYSACLDGDR